MTLTCNSVSRFGKNIRIDRLNLSFGLMHESVLTTDVPLVKVSNAGETSFTRPLIFDSTPSIRLM
jgi:hypothetical protein